MTNKEIADRPRPKPGTVVWFRTPSLVEWRIGEAQLNGVFEPGTYLLKRWERIEWKIARILADDEVAVKVPPVSEWPEDAWVIEAAYTIKGGDARFFAEIITRTEAEAREVGDEG